ncbi:2Fe-2S iron-sulfur cluster-binding protein [Actibacterium sp. MT2.3-13A]|uniref:2Fe-2S iron-sulfur cluster-binding protein n=1 Tax=Actibacterium sp. MT2.3-13A TaxID=2828332 RepID=UPI001BA831C0|nr:2Fe-2S iron-sulfur cluster-binding protein [Actibacterium sp. MT2.3-13A]
MANINTNKEGVAFDCDDEDTILRAALRAGIGMPYSCNVGSCGNCRVELIDGAVEHLRADAPAWSERDLKRNRWLGCQAKPKGDCTIKFRADDSYIPRVRPIRQGARLVGVTPITRDISEFAFRLDSATDFDPGQYALLSVPGVEGARAYSMCNLPGEDLWRFQIRRVPEGAATGALFGQLETGAEIRIDGPYGTAQLRTDTPRDILLLAGGSGLSPMVSIARGARAAGLLGDRRIHFYYGCRSADDAIAPDFVENELGFVDSFVTAISDPAGFDGWTGPKGFLHDVVLADLGGALKEHEIYFAGPPVMAAAIQKTAHENGVPMDQIHFDEFY